MTARHVLLTGTPGSGKTTVVRKVIDLLADVRLAGFYTEEIRNRMGRAGFRVVTLDGRTVPLATVGSGDGRRVGRYTVHVEEFEMVAISQLQPSPDVELIVIDEIGKMECLSPAFVTAARRALTDDLPVLGTVALAGGGLIAEAKHTPGVDVIAISGRNRDRLPTELAQRLRSAVRGPR